MLESVDDSIWGGWAGADGTLAHAKYWVLDHTEMPMVLLA